MPAAACSGARRSTPRSALSFLEMLEGRPAGARRISASTRAGALRRSLTLTGYALVSLLELRLAEGDLAAAWQPLSTLQTAAPTTGARRPICSCRAARSCRCSRRRRATRRAATSIGARSRACASTADYHVIFDEAGFGQRGGARVSASLGPRLHDARSPPKSACCAWRRPTATCRRGSTPSSGCRPRSSPRSTSIAYSLEQPINGADACRSPSAATLGWDFAPRLARRGHRRSPTRRRRSSAASSAWPSSSTTPSTASVRCSDEARSLLARLLALSSASCAPWLTHPAPLRRRPHQGAARACTRTPRSSASPATRRSTTPRSLAQRVAAGREPSASSAIASRSSRATAASAIPTSQARAAVAAARADAAYVARRPHRARQGGLQRLPQDAAQSAARAPTPRRR